MIANDVPVCTVPPAGWTCSRAPGHDGPCAARPNLPDYARVTIATDPNHTHSTQVCLDGVPVPGMRRFTVTQDLSDPFPVLTLELYLSGPAAVSLLRALVHRQDAAAGIGKENGVSVDEFARESSAEFMLRVGAESAKHEAAFFKDRADSISAVEPFNSSRGAE